MNLGESGLSIDKDDLEQEGCIGLLDAIPRFDSSKGAKFLTYAAPSIRNAMTDLIRNVFSQFEQRMTDTTDGLAFQKIRLDEVVPGEERLLRIEAVADPIAKSPEQIYVEQETLRELYEGLDRWTCQYPFRPKEQGMKGGGFAALAPLQHLLWL